jgi:hypothetical protein
MAKEMGQISPATQLAQTNKKAESVSFLTVVYSLVRKIKENKTEKIKAKIKYINYSRILNSFQPADKQIYNIATADDLYTKGEGFHPNAFTAPLRIQIGGKTIAKHSNNRQGSLRLS